MNAFETFGLLPIAFLFYNNERDSESAPSVGLSPGTFMVAEQ